MTKQPTKSACRATAILAVTIGGMAAFAAIPIFGLPFDLSSDSDQHLDSTTLLDLCYNSTDHEYFAVYRRHVANTYDTGIHGRRLDLLGTPLGSEFPVEAFPPSPLEDICQPAVAHAAAVNRYMAVFRGYNPATGTWTVAARVLTPAGADAGSGLILVDGATSDYQYDADVAFDGNRFLVAWVQWGADVSVRGRYFDTTGQPVGAAFDFVHSSADIERVGLSHLGGAAGRYLLVYAHERSGYLYDVKAQVLAAGSETPEAPMTLNTTATLSCDWPRVAANLADQEWLVAWQETDLSSWDNWAGRLWDNQGTPATIGDISFRRVTSAGALQPLGVLEAGPELDFAPAVAWNSGENRYLVHWQRGLYHVGSVQNPPPSSDIYATAINGGSNAIHSPAQPIAVSSREEVTPVLAARAGSSEVLAAWGTILNAPYGNAAYLQLKSEGILHAVAPQPTPTVTPGPSTAEGSGSERSTCLGSAGPGPALGLLLAALGALARRRR